MTPNFIRFNHKFIAVSLSTDWQILTITYYTVKRSNGELRIGERLAVLRQNTSLKKTVEILFYDFAFSNYTCKGEQIKFNKSRLLSKLGGSDG